MRLSACTDALSHSWRGKENSSEVCSPQVTTCSVLKLPKGASNRNSNASTGSFNRATQVYMPPTL